MAQNEFEKFAVKHMGISSLTLHQYAQAVNESAAARVPLALTPQIIEERQLNGTAIDVFSRLMMDRLIFLGTSINDYVANVVMAQLLFLENSNPKKDISIYINSPGGSVYAGLGIYDVMQYVKPDVGTVCIGMAASMGAVLLAAGHAGKRFALPHARVMIHQPLGGAQGQASDILIMAEEIVKVKKELYEILALHSGQPFEQIEKDSDRDYWMRAQEAKTYGMVDEVIAYEVKKPEAKG
jgi:ATP-dependent Clp protease protease subunit